MNFKQWIEDLIEGDSLRTASEKIGLAQSTITRQLSRNTLTAPAVIALCRAYGRKPVDGLVETGYLQPWEIEGVGIDAAIDEATNKQLLDGIMRRSDPEAQYLFGLDEDVINPVMDDRNNVVGPDHDTPVDELAARRSNTNNTETTPHVHPGEYTHTSTDDTTWHTNTEEPDEIQYHPDTDPHNTRPYSHPDFPGLEWDWDNDMPVDAIADDSPEEGGHDPDAWIP